MESFTITDEHAGLEVKLDHTTYGMPLVRIEVWEFNKHEHQSTRKYLTVSQAQELQTYLSETLKRL